MMATDRKEKSEPVERKGDWIQTFSGIQFWPLDPRIEEIDIIDIAHALSMICRFCGHTAQFYSVAQHCVLMSIVGHGHDFEKRNDLRKWALLHDASETYICDLSRPVKKCVNEWYKEIENGIMEKVALKFGLEWPMPNEVKELDNRMLATEKRDLLRHDLPWNEQAEPLLLRITPWSPQKAEREFLRMFCQLFGEGIVEIKSDLPRYI